MPKFERKLTGLLRSRLAEKAPLIQVMIGPRQVGKTTALKAALGSMGVYRTADYPVSLVTSVIEEWWQEGLVSLVPQNFDGIRSLDATEILGLSRL